MCGIVGYIGSGKAVDILLEGLKNLEYRGYDSAGIAVLNSKGIAVRKRVGKLRALEDEVRQHPPQGHLGIGHCLSGDTLIQLADGRAVRIDSLPEHSTVVTFDGATRSLLFRKARVWSHSPPKKLMSIQLPFGRIVCTPQHRLLTVDDEGMLVERQAGALRAGDLLVHTCVWPAIQGQPMCFETVQAPRYYRLGRNARILLREKVAKQGGRSRIAELAGVSIASISHLWDEERNASEAVLRPLASCVGLDLPLQDTESVNSHHGSFVQFPQQSSPAVMQWLGYLVGDGYVGRRGIRFKDPDIDTLTTYQQIAQQYFNFKGRLVPLPDANASLLEINSLGLATWVRRNMLQRRTQFLDEVGALPDEHLAGFLRGLFDAEGGVARRAGQIALAMTDVELVRRIQLWLLRFGVLASTCHEDAKPAQRRPRAALKLLLTRYDALAKFQEAIGFSSVRKRDWLQGVLAAKQEGHYLSSRAVSIRKERLLQWLKDAGVSATVLRPFSCGVRFTDGQVAKLITTLRASQKAADIASDLQRRLDAPIRYQEILSVQRLSSNKALVYDLEVEGTENFFANGILSHNSRWATHGEPTERNAHPHADCTGKFAVIHNGIIENYAELKDRLLEKGHKFRSKTDTEIIVHLIEEYAKSHPITEAFRLALKELRGAYAVCLLSAQEPDRLFGARNSSPLIVGLGKGEAFFASDVPAILGHTRRVVYLKDDEIAELSAGTVRLRTLEGRPVRRGPTTVSFNKEAAQRGGFAHFMLKEIHEQPTALEQTLTNRLDAVKGRVTFDRRTNAFLDALSPQEKLVIIACGTAYHAGLVGEYMLEELARLPVDVDLASEFRYRGPMLDRHTTVVAITQSGETADTLAGVRLAKEQGAKTLAICNVVGSSIAREVDAVLYTHAGPEIAVASTKAYTSQLAALSLITLYLAKRFKRLAPARWRALVKGLAALPDAVRRALEIEVEAKRVAAKYAAARNFYFLGRRSHYPSALEGALKLKEICPLIHAEGYAAGEMKHGPISLIRKGWPVVFLATDSPVYEKVVSNIEEIRARKGSCIVIATEGNTAIKRHAERVLYVPRTEELFSPIVAAIPLQLLAYYIAEANGCDIDQPPNLAKSVTVE